MEVAEFFLKLCIILVAARAAGEAFAWVGLPAVIGEVLAGVVIGPSLLGIVVPDQTFLLLADIGVLFLLFKVGLETDVAKLVEVSGQSTLVAVTGVALPFIGAFAMCRYMFGVSSDASLFAAGAMVATSIGIPLRALGEMGKRHTKVAQVVLGAAVLDDIIGVVVLAMLTEYSVGGGITPFASLKVLVFISVFLALAPTVGPALEGTLSKVERLSKTPGTVPTLVVALILILSFLARKYGAPEIVGAFAAGLALSGRPFSFFGKGGTRPRSDMAEQTEQKLAPIGELFIPVFFVMVGVSINLKVIDFASPAFWAFAGALSAVAFVTKVMSGVWVKGPVTRKLAVGVAMAPRGEVGLIFAQTGLLYRIFDDSVYASIVFVVALTTLAAPIFLKPLMRKEDAHSA
jgi:Kef-type K+ transport system membrane component KefB